MSSFKFSPIEVASKDFHKQRQITDILTIDVKKVVLSDINCLAIMERIPLFIKTPEKIFCYGVSQYDKNSTYTISFNVSEAPELVHEVESQLFEKLTTKPIKGEGNYIHGKLKT